MEKPSPSRIVSCSQLLDWVLLLLTSTQIRNFPEVSDAPTLVKPILETLVKELLLQGFQVIGFTSNEKVNDPLTV